MNHVWAGRTILNPDRKIIRFSFWSDFKNIGSNKVGIKPDNRWKPGNRFGRLTWARDRSIPKTWPIDQSGIELMRSTDLGLVDQYMLHIFSLIGYTYQNWPVRIKRLFTGSIDPFEKEKLQTFGFWGRDF